MPLATLRPVRLSADDRAAIIDEIEENSASCRRYYVLTVLASVIAAVGLLTNSPATIIGAMIIEPSMGPILGLSLGLVRFRAAMKRVAIIALIYGNLIAFVLGFVIGSLPLNYGVTAEMASRAAPTFLDMVVAFASGLAGAYGFVNPRVNPALAGVAISVSLAPPVVASGLFASLGHWDSAGGAIVLYAANFLCILLAAAGVFLYYRLGSPRKAERAGIGAYIGQFLPYLAVSVVIGWFLMNTLSRLSRESGEDRAIHATISSLSFPQGSDIDPQIKREGSEVELTFRGPKPPPRAFMTALRSGIEERVAHSIQLRLKWIQSELFELKDDPGPK